MTPPLTIFTAAARLDLARLWLACVVRAFSREDARVEIFDDSDTGHLRADLLPGATVLRPGPLRRDFQEAYNAALGCAETPWLALIDTDAYAISRDVWPRVRARLESGATAVACAPRRAVAGHDTVALFLDVSAFRAAREAAPEGFLPRAESEDPEGRPGAWRGHDTGDLLTDAVEARGGRIEVLPLEDEGSFVRFDALTNAHLLAAWSGAAPLSRLAKEDAYFREGCLGNLALRGLYGATFPEGAPFAFDVPALAVWSALARGGPSVVRDALSRMRRMRAAVRRLARFLRSAPVA